MPTHKNHQKGFIWPIRLEILCPLIKIIKKVLFILFLFIIYYIIILI